MVTLENNVICSRARPYMPTKVQPALGDTVAVAVPAGGKGGFLWDAGGSVARVTKGFAGDHCNKVCTDAVQVPC